MTKLIWKPYQTKALGQLLNLRRLLIDQCAVDVAPAQTNPPEDCCFIITKPTAPSLSLIETGQQTAITTFDTYAQIPRLRE